MLISLLVCLRWRAKGERERRDDTLDDCNDATAWRSGRAAVSDDRTRHEEMDGWMDLYVRHFLAL